MTRVRPLSSLPSPLTGVEGPESFASLVERLAAHQLIPVPITTLLTATGLIEKDHYGLLPSAYGVDLTPAQREHFSYACRLPPAAVSTTLLRSLDGVAFDLTGLDVTDPNSVRTVAHREWAGFGGSACCPACLAETGGWRLRWKVWTSFVCLTHRRLLLDVCPRCSRRTGNYRADRSLAPRFATHVPRPGHCANSLPSGSSAPGRSALPCGEDLRQVSTLELKTDYRLLIAQHRVNQAMTTRLARVAGEEVSSLTYFRHLRSLTALALHAAQPEDMGTLPAPIAADFEAACAARDAQRTAERGTRGTALHPYKGAPNNTFLVAAVLPWATEVLDAPEQEAVTAELRTLVERTRDIRGRTVWAVIRDFHLQGPLAVAVNQAAPPRVHFHHTVGHRAPAGTGAYRTFDPRGVPQLLWKDVFDRDFRPLLEGSGIGDTAARVAVSVALVRLTGPLSVSAGIELLGLAGHSMGASMNPLIGHLGRSGGKEAFQQALHALATRLEAAPLRDYCAAREALGNAFELDMQTWERCREAAGLAPRKSTALRRNAAAWVWAAALCSHPYFSPALSADRAKQENLREVYRRFERDWLPQLRVPLTAYVSDLQQHLHLI